jgi:Fe-S-cluster containining protein
MILPHDMQPAVTLLFQRLDRAYDQNARAAGFACNGCRDNCCRTRFYHHTLIEVLSIQSGLRMLPADRSLRIRAAAEAALEKTTQQHRRREPVDVMCPLNENHRCVLYGQRPMICRLHGIPHVLRLPDGRTRTGPGCDDFYRQCGRGADPLLDRTPLYGAMADLEQRLRKRLNYHGKIKMTVAEIIVDDTFLGDYKSDHEIDGSSKD